VICRRELELLEGRTLPSAWLAKGPAPILGGNVPGNGPIVGRITAVAAHPTDPNTIYIAAAGGGVWKTEDGGQKWTPLTDDQATLFMGALALAPTDANIIYAGTGEANGISNDFLPNIAPSIFSGRGVLKSVDGGKSWGLLGSDVFDRRSIAKIVVDPTSADIVYAAVGQPGISGLLGNQGVWKTADGGKNWINATAASGIADTVAFTDVVIDPSNPQHLLAAAGSPRGNSSNGLYQTSDGGRTWTLSTGSGTFPTGTSVGRIALAISPTNSQRLYGSVAGPGGNLFRMLRSDDGGALWLNLSAPNYLGFQGWYDTTLAVDPTDPDRVYAGGQSGPSGIIESTNAGASWFGIAVGASGRDGTHHDHHGIAFDAAQRLLDGNDGGIWRLDNPDLGKIRWADLNGNLQIATFIGIALHPTDANIAYGGGQDIGTEKFTGLLGWKYIADASISGDGGFVRVDPQNPSTVYHEHQGLRLRRSDDGGITWRDIILGISGPGNFYIPYVLDPLTPTRLLLGTNRVFETTNRGESWQALSVPGVGGWTVSSAIDSLAPATGDPNTIYASAGGHLFVTTTHGAAWNAIDVPGYTDHFFDLQVDPTDRRIAYTARGLFGGGHVFQTIDGGLHWTDISGNLPDLPVFTIALGQSSLYVGTDAGVFSSEDGGKSWNPFGDGLPNAQVRQLVLNSDLGILAAGTHGRGLWEVRLAKLAGNAFPLARSAPVSQALFYGAVSLTGVDRDIRSQTEAGFASIDPTFLWPRSPMHWRAEGLIILPRCGQDSFFLRHDAHALDDTPDLSVVDTQLRRDLVVGFLQPSLNSRG
jgi:photosystem II stability/assembly factor-like uncharacterized protein